MRFNFSALNRFYLPLVAVVILLVCFGGYFFIYVEHQKEYHTRHNLRELAVLGEQLQGQIRTYQRVLKNRADYISSWFRENPVKLRPPLQYLRAEALGTLLQEWGCVAPSANKPDLLEGVVQVCLAKPYINDRVPDLSYVDPEDAPEKERELSLISQDDEYWLHLSSQSKSEVGSGAEAFHVRVYAKVKVSEIFKKFVTASQFDNVILANEVGAVIFQSPHPELRVTAVPQLADGKGHVATSVIDADFGGTTYKLFIQPVNLTLDSRGDASPGPSRSATFTGSVTLGRNAKQDQSSPAAMTDAKPAGKQSEARGWVICGLVDASRFGEETRAISYSVIMWFAFLLLMIFLLGPFLKLALLAPGERVPRLEGLKLFLATLLGSAALTLCVTDVYYFGRVKSKLDDSLEQVAKTIDEHVTDELHSIAKQLAEYDAVRVRDECDGGPQPSLVGSMLKNRDRVDARVYPYMDMVFWTDRQGNQRMKWSLQPSPTALVSVEQREYFKRVRQHRESIRNLAVLNPPRPRRDPTAADGSEAIASTGVEAKSGRSDNGSRFWIESVHSWTTGVDQAAYSTTAADKECKTEGGEKFEAYMIAGVMRPLSLMEPVLPPGFDFAVVDNTGLVLFHSNSSRVLIENFIAEADDNPELASAIRGRVEKPLKIRYGGRDHHAYVRPLSHVEGLPWALIVFHEMWPLRTANLEVLTTTSVMFLLYLAFLLLAVNLVFAAISRTPLWFLARNDSPVSFWPDRKKKPVYWQLVLLITLLTLCLVGWIISHEGTSVAVAALLIPVYSCILTVLAVRYGERLSKGALLWKWVLPMLAVTAIIWFVVDRDTLTVYPFLGVAASSLGLASKRVWRELRRRTKSAGLRSYLVALTASFVIGSALPCIAFFKVAYVLERELLAQHRQVELARALESRSQRVRENYAQIQIPGSKEEFLRQRLETETLDVYLHRLQEGGDTSNCGPWIPCVRFTEIKAEPPRTASSGEHDPIRDLFQMIRPLYNDFASETGTLLYPSSLSPANDGQALKLTRAFLNDRGVEITALLPHMGAPTYPLAWIAWIGWSVVLLLLYGGVRLVARRLFLIDIPVPERRLTHLGKFDSLRRNLLVLGHPFSCKSEVLKSRGDLHVVDMVQVERNPEELDLQKLPRNKVVALDQFEYKMDDPELTNRKLCFLEELVYVRRKNKEVKNHNVLIVSSVDPVFYTANGGSGNGLQAGELEKDLGRWAGVLSSFEVVDYEDQPDPPMGQILERFCAKFSASSEHPENDRDLKMTQELKQLLQSECGSTSALRRIAADVVDSVPEGVRLRKKGLADMIDDRCETYYRSLWTACSKAEKLMLIQLAEEGFVNRKNERVIRHLMRKGLILRTPKLRLMNESFHRFVLAARQEENIRQWEQEAAQGGWLAWRPVLIVVLLMLVGFLAFTQQEVLEAWVPILGSLAGGLAVILRLISTFQMRAAQETESIS